MVRGRHNKKAQASLELSLALIGVLIILFGAFNVFMWVNKRIINRQRDYESKRVTAGSTHSSNEVGVSDINRGNLNILKRR